MSIILKKNIICYQQTKNTISPWLLDIGENRFASHFEIEKRALKRNKIASYSKIEEKAIKRNIIANYFKIKEKIEGINKNIYKVNFFY